MNPSCAPPIAAPVDALRGLVQILNDAMVRPWLAIRGRNELLALLSLMKHNVVEC
jgi:hypothetical protein